MSLLADLSFALKGRCPVCREGRLFKSGLNIVDACSHCGARLGDHDIGDGAAVFLIFILGFTIVPLAWWAEVVFAPPIWAHVVVFGGLMLAAILLLLPAIKAYIMLLQYRHRPGEWGK